MYRYRGVVKHVYDGDTITVDIDLGFSIWVKGEKLRLMGINTPEIRGEERDDGIKSRDFLRSVLPVGKELVVQTKKDRKGKYGRYLAWVYCDYEGNFLTNVNDLLVEKGYAQRKDY